MNHPILFNPAQPHSQTSMAAAKKIDLSGLRRTQCERIIGYMTACGTDGATIRQINNQFGLGMNISSARIRDLEKSGQIVKTKMARISPGSDSPGDVYVMTARYEVTMGLGAKKDTVDKAAYQKLKEALELYARGLNDSGKFAKCVLEQVT